MNSFDNLFKRHFIYLGLMPFLFLIKSLLGYPFYVTFLDLILCIGTLISGSYILFKGINYLLKDRYKAAYLLFVIFILCFFSVDIYYVLLAPYLRIRYYLLGVILVIVLCLWLFKKRWKPATGINRVLNVFSVAFVCIYLLNSFDSIRTAFHKSNNTGSIYKQVLNNTHSIRQLPDIYLLLLDGYANSNNLQTYWHFSNNTFLDALRSEGFYVVDSSRSNYAATVQTVSSMLNMEYSHRKFTGVETPFLFDIVSNKTVNLLSQNGYDIFNYSLFDFDNYSSPNRLKAFPGHSSLFDYLLSGSIYFFYTKMLADKEEELQPDLKDRKLYNQLNKISKIKNDKPKFVYGHFFVSHPPFYLDSTGRVNKKVQELTSYTAAESKGFSTEDTTDNTFGNVEKDRFIMQSYLNHIKAANAYIQPLVKSIILNAKRPPIVLIMSDHGFRYTTGITDRQFKQERYGNLCAFYFPDKDYSMLSNAITPVNYMRLIFSKAFQTPYKPLPDRSHL